MKNKICVEVNVPTIEMRFDVFIPKNIKVKTFLIAINKYIYDKSNNQFPIRNDLTLIDENTGTTYDINKTILDNDILNDTKLIII